MQIAGSIHNHKLLEIQVQISKFPSYNSYAVSNGLEIPSQFFHGFPGLST